MPVVYACVCPIAPAASEGTVADALQRVSEELAAYEPELAVVVAPALAGSTRIGVFASDYQLTERMLAEAKKNVLPVEQLRRPAVEPPFSIGAAATCHIATCLLEPRAHFDFGRAATHAIEASAVRVAVICAVRLSRGGAAFDAHYRRLLAAWDVKSLVNMDTASRRSSGERAVAETAVLMGALGRYRVQPRELAFEGGQIIVAIDVLGGR